MHNLLQILMSVLKALMTAVGLPLVLTLQGATPVNVFKDTEEMVTFALVG